MSELKNSNSKFKNKTRNKLGENGFLTDRTYENNTKRSDLVSPKPDVSNIDY